MLVALDYQRVDIYSRSQAWELILFTQESDKFSFESVGLNLTLVEIYQDVIFEH